MSYLLEAGTLLQQFLTSAPVCAQLPSNDGTHMEKRTGCGKIGIRIYIQFSISTSSFHEQIHDLLTAG